MKYFISDTHFYHANIIKFDQRPFKTLEEMHETIIRNWNGVVKSGDDVYILGDFCWKTAQDEEYQQLLKVLNGNKHLILGNHDPKNMTETQQKKFSSVSNFKEFTDNQQHVILCHYPMPFYKSSYGQTNWMLYGHVHNLTKEAKYMNDLTSFLVKNCATTSENRGHLINVGCMMPYMNYTPQPLEYLIETWNKIYGGQNNENSNNA